MFGNLHTDFSNLVLDLVYYIVQLEEYINVHYPVVLVADLGYFFIDMIEQFAIRFEMQGLYVHSHESGFFGVVKIVLPFKLRPSGLASKFYLLKELKIIPWDGLSCGYRAAFLCCCVYTPGWQPDCCGQEAL